MHLDILPKEQRALWPELSQIPDHFTLYGGTAIALQLGHRVSIDFDFFTFQNFNHDDLFDTCPFLTRGKIIQQSPNTITILLGSDSPVQISFFGVPRLNRIMPPFKTQDNAIKIAQLIDLAGTKAATVQKRAEVKDYIDMDALLTKGGLSLPDCLGAAQFIYGESYNPAQTLKALCYFDDGNVTALNDDERARLMNAVKSVDLDSIPVFKGEA